MNPSEVKNHTHIELHPSLVRTTALTLPFLEHNPFQEIYSQLVNVNKPFLHMFLILGIVWTRLHQFCFMVKNH